jgi:CHAT domain
MPKRIRLYLGAQLQIQKAGLDVLPATLTIHDEAGEKERLSSYLLPPPDSLHETFAAWRKYINPQSSATRKIRLEPLEDHPLHEDENIDLKKIANDCKRELNYWLNTIGWLDQHGQLDPKIKKALERNQSNQGWDRSEVQISIETTDTVLGSLPWQEWDVFRDYCIGNSNTEVSISATDFRRPEQKNSPQLSAKVRILAVFGDERLELNEEKRLIANLSRYGGDVQILDRPDERELAEHLLDPNGWHIFFFAGHSSSENGGWLEINPGIKMPVVQLTEMLASAIDNKLQLAIFNSCDGLNLANSLTALSLPYCIVMREAVDSAFARRLLQHFLTSFVTGKSLFAAMHVTRRKLQTEFDEDGKHPGKSWLPAIVANPQAQILTWDGLFTDRRLDYKWEILLGLMATLAIFALPIVILWEFGSLNALKHYARIYPHIFIYPSLFLWVVMYALYRAICLTRKKPFLFWVLTFAALSISFVSMILDWHASPVMLFELKPHAVATIGREELTKIATANNFSIEQLLSIPKQLIHIGGNDGSFVFHRDDIEAAVWQFTSIISAGHHQEPHQSYQGFLRIALSSELWQNAFKSASYSRWFYSFSHFVMLFCMFQTFSLTASAIVVPTSIFKKHRYFAYFLIAQLGFLGWTPFYLYYVGRIKSALFSPTFDPRLSNVSIVYYTTFGIILAMTLYLFHSQINIAKYRFLAKAFLLLGIALSIATGLWGVGIIDQVVGIRSGGVFTTWLGSLPVITLFFIAIVYAIDTKIKESP